MEVTILSDELGTWLEWPGGPQTAAEAGAVVHCLTSEADDTWAWLPETRWLVVTCVPGEVLVARDRQTGGLFSWDLRHYDVTAVVEREGVFIAAPVIRP